MQLMTPGCSRQLPARPGSVRLRPAMQPQPDKPLASCNQFERVWSFDPTALLADPSGALAPAVSLAVTGAEGGVTVWRAVAPTGYAVTGDIVTPGTSQVGAGALQLCCTCAALHGGLLSFACTCMNACRAGRERWWTLARQGAMRTCALLLVRLPAAGSRVLER